MSDVKLMKPLFYCGNFNAGGKRMKAVLVKEVSDGANAYRLWRSSGVPDRDYPRAENNTHILHVETGEYLAPLGMTEYELIGRCGYTLAVAELYGNEENRQKYFADLRSSRRGCTDEIPKALELEGNAERRLGSDPAHQAAYIKTILNDRISTYLTAKENGGESFPDFVGAAILGEIDLCRELAGRYKAKKRAEYAARQARAEAEAKKQREETNRQAEQQLQQAIHILKTEGALNNDSITLCREDGSFGEYSIVNHLMRRYGVEVPLRTQGWINEKLSSITVKDGRCSGVRYLRAKGGSCSQKIFDCIDALLREVHGESEVAA